MFFTANQLVAHAVGDYLTQSHWIANNKTKKKLAALIHVVLYGVPFLFLTRSIPALLVIVGTHFAIDHWRLARHVIWLKNFIGPGYRDELDFPVSMWQQPDGSNPAREGKLRGYLYYKTPPEGEQMIRMPSRLHSPNPSWDECKDNFGFPPDTPIWMSFWLMVIVDNLLHILINAAALNWL